MKNRLFRLISTGPAEKSGITILLCQSVFLGIFYGTFDVTAHSVFLSVFDEKMMAGAYIASGLGGIILTTFYSWLHRRFEFRNLAIANLIFITTVTLILWIILSMNPAGWVLFTTFIMLGPLNILAMLGFRGNINRLLIQSSLKNLTGIFEGGLITGILLSCFVIPILLYFKFATLNILLIGAAAVFIATIIQVIPVTPFIQYPEEDHRYSADEEGKVTLLQVLREDPLIRTVVIFFSLAIMSAFFIQYSFMAITRIQYPSAEEMARFLGLFTGSMMILTLVIKFLAFPNFVRNFRLFACLVISPFLIALFTVIAVITGFISGYTQAAAGFMLFFILLAMSRLFSRSLRDSLDSGAVRIILWSVDGKTRDTTETGITGVINEIAATVSGIILVGLGMMSFMKLIHFSLALIIITILWIVIAFKLYSVYRNTVIKPHKADDRTGIGPDQPIEFTKFKSRFPAKLAFTNDYISIINGDLSSFERNNSRWYMIEVLDHAEIKEDINLLPVLRKIRSGTGYDKELRQRSAEIIARMERISSVTGTKQGRGFHDVPVLTDLDRPDLAEVLKLLRDRNPDLRKIALSLIMKFRMTEILDNVCDCLGDPALEIHATNVIKSFGEKANEPLRRYYFLSAGNINICKTILKLFGNNCNREDEEFLFSLLWTGPGQIREAALKGLAGCNYRIRDEDKERILRLISDVIGIITWDLSARVSINSVDNPVLLEAINRDIVRWELFLLNLLSITYDSGVINNIRENIEKGTVESVNSTLEMIDITVDESVRIKLKPLFDNISDKRKLNILHRFYPGEIFDYKRLEEDIINRDYNLLGVWIRACVIRNMPEIKNHDLLQSLVALLFSPETILREETARLFSRSGKKFFRESSDRIPPESRERLESIINGTVSDRDLLFERVKFLKSLFQGLPEENLFFLAGGMIFADAHSSIYLPVRGGYILWKCTYKSSHFQTIVSYENIFTGITGQDSDSFSYILPLNIVEEYFNKFPEHNDEILIYIDGIE